MDGLTELERPMAKVFLNLAARYRPKEVLEVGSGWGIFTFAVLSSDENIKVITIDKIPVEGRPDFNDRTAGLENRIERIVADSMLMLPEMVEQGRKFDMILVDAAHGYENCLEDIRNSWKLLRTGGILLVDDVLHKNNYKVNDDMELDYGVGQALWDWQKEVLDPGTEIRFYLIGSGGVAVIDKII